MSKPKYSAVKLFDNRKPLNHSSCGGRQKRACSCFQEINNQNHKLKPLIVINETEKLSNTNIESLKLTELVESSIIIDSNINLIDENSSYKENLTSIYNNDNNNNEEIHISNEILIFDNDLKLTHSSTTSIDNTSNSLTDYNITDSDISSIAETSNSSWNVISDNCLNHLNEATQNINKPTIKSHDINNNNIRNIFPNVLVKKEIMHMNLCRDNDSISIPIRNNNYNGNIKSQIDKCYTLPSSETSFEYDLETDKYNNSLIDYSNNQMFNSDNSSKSTNNKSINNRKSCNLNNKIHKSIINGKVVLFAYISDIKGVEDSLVFNKDRRFTKIIERYNCKATILQMTNLKKGYPHVLLKIEADNQNHLTCMARDTDRSYPNWNLRSQLRSVHIN